MKKWPIRAIMLIILLSLFIAGCSKDYTADYGKKFASYLDYSMGNYETIVNKEKTTWKVTAPMPESGTGLRWVIAFTDDHGVNREFEFWNYGYTQGGDSSNFGYAVMDYAMGLGQERIVQDVLLPYFRPDEIGLKAYQTNETKTSIAIFSDFPFEEDDNYAKFVNPGTGIKLRSLHPKQLVHDWNASYSFKVYTLLTDEAQMKELLAKIEKTMRSYAEYVDHYDLLPVEVDGKDNEDRFQGTYHKETDSFTWIPKKE